MISAGYMAKRVCNRPEWLKAGNVVDVYSLSGCVSDFFTDYEDQWKHNGHWLFDSPQIIRAVAQQAGASLDGTLLFYYEVFESQFDGNEWQPYIPESSFVTDVSLPSAKKIEGYDVVTFYAGSFPECSPLSCNSLATEIQANSHCLFSTFEQAKSAVDCGAFDNSEPGPYRIFAVYSVEWE